jgi:DNA repair photolyase
MQSEITNPNVYTNLKLTEGRFFINITSQGCGSGCSYCYINGAQDKQVLIEEEQLFSSINYLRENKNFVLGKQGTLISLCPDTEPFKTENSTSLIMNILKTILPWGNPIQIPTKERIPQKILKIIKSLMIYPEQVVIFVSSSTISKASKIEPYAALPYERFSNFKLCQSYNILSCLYIKPFLLCTEKDIELYIDVIHDYQVSLVCIGILYTKNSATPILKSNLHHPVHLELTSKGLNDKSLNFRTKIAQKFELPIFYSSVCVSAYVRNWIPSPKIWIDFPSLCINCRNCDSDYQH